MGIKFKCPNGHKLNVKSFLAGKKGMCPHCGAKFRIPQIPAEDDQDDGPALDVSQQPAQPLAAGQSQPAPANIVAAVDQPAAQVQAGAVTQVPMGHAVSPPGGSVQPQPAMAGAPAVATAVRPATTASVAPVGAAVPVGAVAVGGVPVGTVPPGTPVGQAVPVGQAIPAAPLDPISENPNATWYVRPPSGGQYGPARGEVMRKWIEEGRVSGTSLVWREGWPDWRSAADVLPMLNSAQSATPTAPADPIVAPVTTRVTNRYVSRKKKSNAVAIAALVLLTLVCLAMVAVLVVVLGGVQLGSPA